VLRMYINAADPSAILTFLDPETGLQIAATFVKK
jgi:hypothetical protein